MGELSSVTLPTGAAVAYNYALNGLSRMKSALISNPVKVKTVTVTDGSSPAETTQYSWTTFGDIIGGCAQNTSCSRVLNPDGGTTTQWYNDPQMMSNPARGLVYEVQQPDGQTVTRTWIQNLVPSFVPAWEPANPYVQTETQTLSDNLTSATTAYSYDRNGNETAKTEKDWDGSTKRTTTITPYYRADLDANAYWSQGSPAARNLVGSTFVSSGGGVTYDYDSHGNERTSDHYDTNGTTKLASTSKTYDSFGNLHTFTDGLQNTTTYTYDSEGLCLVTITDAASHDTHRTCDRASGSILTETDANGIVKRFVYDTLGRIHTVAEAAGSDPNQLAASARLTTTTYDDAARTVAVVSDLSGANDVNDQALEFITSYDQLGRAALVRRTDDNGMLGISEERHYQVSGGYRYEAVSNPYRTAQDPTMGWTRTKRDQLGRVVEIASFAGSEMPLPWGNNSATTGATTMSYFLNTTTISDQNSKGVRKNTMDALRRPKSVVEDPDGSKLTTTYDYDPLDDLTSVIQGTQPSRSFTYDGLGRLISTTNPENGKTDYNYDAAGNIITKRDASGRITCYGSLSGTSCTSTYDKLNRVHNKTYSDGTPTVTYAYDSSQYGKLDSISSSVSTTTYSTYDQLGRITRSHENIGGVDYNDFVYTYNRADGLTSMTYPSGRLVSYGYSSASRPNLVSAPGVTYADSMTYAPNGALASFHLGHVFETTSYNSRFQTTAIQLGTSVMGNNLWQLTNDYGTTKNSGNLMQQTISIPGQSVAFYQYYDYDSLNRLTSAVEYGGQSTTDPQCQNVSSHWCEAYGYNADVPLSNGQFGNRVITARMNLTAMSTEPATFDGNTNRIKTGQNGGSFAYDNGNVIRDSANATYGYDAEKRMVAYCSGGANPCTTTTPGATVYSYDGLGRRVVKSGLMSGTTTYLYDAAGQLAAEYSSGPVSGSGRQYLTQDALGNARVITDDTGSVTERRDYYPFGGAIAASTTNGRACSPPSSCSWLAGYSADVGVTQLFTGKERDSETGLDYFGARYFSGAQGRFTSPDVINLTSARLLNPSNTLNKYVYAANNPLKYVDPDGLDITLYYRPPSGAPMDFGHVFLGALNQSSGEVAFLDYYPPDGTNGFGSGRGEFNPGDMQDRAGQNYASLTIQTTPEQAQNVINIIKGLKNGTPAAYSALSHNCTTVCQDALADLGLSFGDITPTGFWNDVFQRYSAAAVARKQRGFVGTIQNFFQPLRPVSRPGTEFGVPRNFGPGNFDLFYLYFNHLANPQPRACVEVSDSATGTHSKQCQ